MNIFVTGGNGFLGSHLTRALRELGHEVVAPNSKDANLRFQNGLDPWNKTAFDRIYHLAAWTQAGDFCLHHAGEQWIINQEINTNILSWWKNHQPQAKLIAIGSSCCYEPGTPHREEHFLSGMPIESLYTYAMTKRMLYTGLLALHKQFGLDFLFLVPSTLYGPDYHLDGRQMHFIFDLMRKIIEGERYGRSVELWGDGYQKRELIHVQDFVRAMLRLSETNSNEIVNIGGGSEHTIREFADLLCGIIGFDSNHISYDTSRYVGATSKVLEINKLKRLLPDFTHTELATGLAETVAWYQKNLPQDQNANEEEVDRYITLAKDAREGGRMAEFEMLKKKAVARNPRSAKLRELEQAPQTSAGKDSPSEARIRTRLLSAENKFSIDQFVTSFAYGDGVGNAIRTVARILREWGFASHIFAEGADERLKGEWHWFQQHQSISNPRNVLLYHPSDGRTAILPYLISIPDRKYLYYHNITPPQFFEPWDPATAEICRTALEAVGAIRPFMRGAVADSQFNANDLLSLGYESAAVLSLPFFRHEFTSTAPSPEVLETYGDGRTNILFVGRFAPNKCQHDVIRAFASYQRSFNPHSRLILAGSTMGSDAYTRSLEQLVVECGAQEVVFTGHISFPELIGYYRVADIFLCLSEHEGFCLPLLEAMHFEIPIVAFESSAVAETLANSARMIKTKDELRIAAQLDAIHREKAVRNVIVSRQLARLESFTEERFRERLANFIEPLLLENVDV